MEWKISSDYVPYPEAVAYMEQRVAEIRAGTARELVWLLEHPPLYTSGSSAKQEDLLQGNRFPVYDAGRGGEYTYHGPGQRVAYVMIDLKRLFGNNAPDLRAYIKRLEKWIIAALSEFGVEGFIRDNRIGVWVKQETKGHSQSKVDSLLLKAKSPSEPSTLPPANDSVYTSSEAVAGHVSLSGGENKIAAIGVRVRQWVSYHGIAINVHPDLSHYNGIVPCGIKDFGVTSLKAMGKEISLEELDSALKKHASIALATTK